MIVRLKADCQNCGLPADDQPQAFTVAAIHQGLALTWPCPYCGDGLRMLGRAAGLAALRSGAIIDPSARTYTARTHGPLL
ncbi:hypothetical protein JCM9957A_61280 [Kineosporia succinea]|uniref:Uncharacterized protein (DUF983 family) n=1 Tax=Kineosporia succinea TaxID=84632 RepID=A0ABT9P9H9_9ACTN|nr:uncharacterized protein (DUF983 family) [Kineosporia succinea]